MPLTAEVLEAHNKGITAVPAPSNDNEVALKLLLEQVCTDGPD